MDYEVDLFFFLLNAPVSLVSKDLVGIEIILLLQCTLKVALSRGSKYK